MAEEAIGFESERERILDKQHQPNEEFIREFMGDIAWQHPKIQEHWKNRYLCGEAGGWIHYSVTSDDELADLIRLVGVKVSPKRK